MREFNFSRRRFLTGSATALSGLALSLGLARYGFANAAAAQEAIDKYQPVFFNEQEWKAVIALCDRLIPDDETGPGAVAAMVPVYIDRQMGTEYANGGLWYMHGPFYPETAPEFGYQYKYTPRDIYRIGLSEVAAHCKSKHDKTFDTLEEKPQTDLLKGLEDGSIELEAIPGPVFFSQLLANVKEGFFADPMYGGNSGMVGWKMLGFPGAQGDYREVITKHNQEITIAPVSIKRQEG
ncbi:gluconate 2-dehydrogenase [Deltaproteobacteria bacterium Smac51]|nr:gluconate 2-dehydrogenase [Deltaproteobacteria bacterium Smac51]